MKNMYGYVYYEFEFPNMVSQRINDFFLGEWFVSCNYDYYYLYSGSEEQRLVTTCIITHNQDVYVGITVLNPKDRPNKDKAQKIAFGRALDRIMESADIKNRVYRFPKQITTRIRRKFWEKFLSELSSNNE